MDAASLLRILQPLRSLPGANASSLNRRQRSQQDGIYAVALCSTEWQCVLGGVDTQSSARRYRKWIQAHLPYNVPFRRILPTPTAVRRLICARKCQSQSGRALRFSSVASFVQTSWRWCWPAGHRCKSKSRTRIQSPPEIYAIRCSLNRAYRPQRFRASSPFGWSATA